MHTLIVKESCDEENYDQGQDQSSYLQTRIARVNTGLDMWTGKLSDVEIVRPEHMILGTRIMRGTLIVNKKYIKREERIVGDFVYVMDSPKESEQNRRIGHLCNMS